ncbi:MAG: helix-turn-helix domain-containing protein, partial [Acidobacteriota bacterium]
MKKKKRNDAEEQSPAPAVDEPTSEAKSFGPWLRRQREGRDIELRDIAQASKISLRYLDALENNRFEALPAELFTKGFLRQYASFVGLDAEEVVNYYLAAKSAADEEKAEDVPEELRLERRGGSKIVPILLVTLLVLGLAGAAYWWFTQRGTDGDGASTSRPAPTAPATPSPAPETTAPSTTQATLDTPSTQTANESTTPGTADGTDDSAGPDGAASDGDPPSATPPRVAA